MRFIEHYFIEKENGTYKYSSTQVDFPEEIAEQVENFSKTIPDKHIYEEEDNDSYGREDEIHTTVLYGIHDEDPEAVKNLIKDIKPFIVKMGEISFFESDNYNVMKIDIISDELHELHEKIKENIKNTQTWPEYKPHCTIAYVIKDYDDSELDVEEFKDMEVFIDSITFSSMNGEKYIIPLKE